MLKVLQVASGNKSPIIWDSLYTARSSRARTETQEGAIALECLPAYAFEFNPVECIRKYFNNCAMPNSCAGDIPKLAYCARRPGLFIQRFCARICLLAIGGVVLTLSRIYVNMKSQDASVFMQGCIHRRERSVSHT